MVPRAIWKGVLKVAELTCPVALYTAASTAERISFHMLNRKTGNRIQREFVDEVTGKPVEHDDQVKGYDRGNGDYIVFEPEEIAAAVPESDKTLDVSAFLACDDIDVVFLDRPYYIAPSSQVAAETFALLRAAMVAQQSAALARTVIFRKMRSILIRPHGKGLIGITLNFDYEVRSAKDAFSDVPKIEIEDEMLDLAKHIIETKKGDFDPKAFDDRYESALANLVKAKIAGRKLNPRRLPPPTKVVDLMEALRQSAKGDSQHSSTTKKPTTAAKARGKTARTTARKAS